MQRAGTENFGNAACSQVSGLGNKGSLQGLRHSAIDSAWAPGYAIPVTVALALAIQSVVHGPAASPGSLLEMQHLLGLA